MYINVYNNIVIRHDFPLMKVQNINRLLINKQITLANVKSVTSKRQMSDVQIILNGSYYKSLLEIVSCHELIDPYVYNIYVKILYAGNEREFFKIDSTFCNSILSNLDNIMSLYSTRFNLNPRNLSNPSSSINVMRTAKQHCFVSILFI